MIQHACSGNISRAPGSVAAHPEARPHTTAALRILIVEDEMLPAMRLETAVADAGYEARKAARLSKALELARAESFDAAVLDVNLAGESVSVFPVAALLREQGVPFLFASGYGTAHMPSEYQDCAALEKPYTTADFNSALQTLLTDVGRAGTAATARGRA